MSNNSSPRRDSFVADNLATGLTVMLLMTLVQRGLGFVRGIGFCRYLSDDLVGQWAMAYGFIVAIPPIMMLGLPGAMPRFVERYRTAGQLGPFIRRVFISTWIGCSVVLAVMLLMPQTFAWIVFRESTSVHLILAVELTLVIVLAFNFVYQLISALRQVRTSSLMQFIQGVGFTLFAFVAIFSGRGLLFVILAFAMATLVATIPGLWVLRRDWSGLPRAESAFESTKMWRSLLPYAISLWLMNLLTNAFEFSDRYMILHWLPGGQEVAKSSVGQYHSASLIPGLITSLAMTFAGLILPYLSADWEAGRRDAIQRHLDRAMFLAAVSFTGFAAFTVAISPWMFSSVLQGRYGDGLRLQPMMFTIYIWSATVTIGQTYLWVRERGGLVGWSLAIGLVANIVLNRIWVPSYGLSGAVSATLVANGWVLVGTIIAMLYCGYRFSSTLTWIVILPITLMFSWQLASVAALSSLLLHAEAKLWLSETACMLAHRLRLRKSNPEACAS